MQLTFHLDTYQEDQEKINKEETINVDAANDIYHILLYILISRQNMMENNLKALKNQA